MRLAIENAVDEKEKVVNGADEQLKLITTDMLKDRQKLKEDRKKFKEDRKKADEELKKAKESMIDNEGLKGLFHMPIKYGKIFAILSLLEIEIEIDICFFSIREPY